MNFEIVGKIDETETIAVGSAVRIRHVCEKDSERDAGGSGKELRKSGFGMVRYVLLRFIGSKRMESERNS